MYIYICVYVLLVNIQTHNITAQELKQFSDAKYLNLNKFVRVKFALMYECVYNVRMGVLRFLFECSKEKLTRQIKVYFYGASACQQIQASE